MHKDTKTMLEYLRNEVVRLDESIDKFLSSGLDDMVDEATAHKRALEAKIKELEAEV